jgi:hypothetical protein
MNTIYAICIVKSYCIGHKICKNIQTVNHFYHKICVLTLSEHHIQYILGISCRPCKVSFHALYEVYKMHFHPYRL